MSTLLPSNAEYRLSESEIERFVEDGFLLVPACFSGDVAAAMVRATLDDRDPPPVFGRKPDEAQLLDLRSVDFRDPTTWGGRTRIDLQTGRRLNIEQFAPRLWGAIESLIGPENAATRRDMGEMWIVKARDEVAGGPRLDDREYFEHFVWHIDAPGEATTLGDRRDALVLLILWTDCAHGGGGPLYSGESLEHVVRMLESQPAGVDTRGLEWASSIAGRCRDVRELTGHAGDVLITHPFALHAAQSHFSDVLRVLENPTITVEHPLCYETDNPRPSPVERAVLRRLERPRPRPRDEFAGAARYLVEHHDDYFMPGRGAWTARVDDAERARVHSLDAWLATEWAARVAKEIVRANSDPLRRVAAAVARVRALTVNQRVVRGEVRESAHDDDFEQTTFARLLRGFVNCEGQNHLLGLVLSAFSEEVRLFDTIDPETQRSRHALLLVQGAEGSYFADAWSSYPIFHVATRAEPPHPGTPEYAELVRMGARTEQGLLPREHYERGRAMERPLRLAHVAVVNEALASVRSSTTSGREESAWRALLRVRARHVGGERRDVASEYGELITKHRLGGMTRELARALGDAARRGP